MQIKSKKIHSRTVGNISWVEELFTFETGQKAQFNTHTHECKCFNGIGRDITETDIGKQMIKAVEQFDDAEHDAIWRLQHSKTA